MAHVQRSAAGPSQKSSKRLMHSSNENPFSQVLVVYAYRCLCCRYSDSIGPISLWHKLVVPWPLLPHRGIALLRAPFDEMPHHAGTVKRPCASMVTSMHYHTRGSSGKRHFRVSAPELVVTREQLSIGSLGSEVSISLPAVDWLLVSASGSRSCRLSNRDHFNPRAPEYKQRPAMKL